MPPRDEAAPAAPATRAPAPRGARGARGRRTCTGLAPALALALAACGTDVAPAAGVIHLDPRLADGSSPADGLSALAATVWSVARDGEREVVERGAGLPAREERGTGAFDGWTWPADFAADLVDEVQVDVATDGPVRGLLSFATARELAEPGGHPVGHSVAARAAPGPSSGGRATLVFSVGGEEGWREAVGRFAVTLEGRPDARPVALRLVQRGFLGGDEPVHAELAQRDSGDGGLVPLGRDARRAWPAVAEEPLFARASLPRGARFAASLAQARGAGGRETELALDVRALPDGAWREAGRWRVGPGAWQPVSCDLRREAGRAVELRLTATALAVADEGQRGPQQGAAGGAEPPPPGTPRRARALWGNPCILGELAADRRPDVVLVTLDTTRADAVGEGRRTPELDRLSADGVVFRNAFAPTNSTQPSHASLLTGFALQDHGVVDNYSRLAPEVVTAAERLRGAGYLTAAAVSQPCIGLGTGLAQGFDLFLQPGPESHLDGRGTVDGVRAWLGELAGAAPLFLWVHLYDPHTPYAPPADFLARWTAEHGLAVPPRRAEPPSLPEVDVLPPDMQFLLGATNLDHARFLYGAGVAYADALLGELQRALDPRAEHLAWIVTADHGESLGERRSYFNHLGVFAETIRVPLVLVLPPGLRAAADLPTGLRVDATVSGVDVAPTLLELAGVSAVGPGRGRSLLTTARAARSGSAPARTVWFEHANGRQVGATDGRSYFVTTVGEGMTFGLAVEVDAEGRRVPVAPPVPVGSTWLFDAASDPALARDLSAERPAEVARFREELERFRAGAAGLATLEREMTPEQAAELSGLGYVNPR